MTDPADRKMILDPPPAGEPQAGSVADGESAAVVSDPLAVRLSAETGADGIGRIAAETVSRSNTLARRLHGLSLMYGRELAGSQAEVQAGLFALAEALRDADPLTLAAQGRDWLTDAAQRTVLTLDTLRVAADAARDTERIGLKPVLAFDYDVVVEGATLPRPVNFSLVRVRPPASFPPTRPDLRPWVIIDPRSGQGSGIGGFKDASEVGNALAEGYPVYFVIFTQYPEPGQTLADITAAEAVFLREVAKAHPGTGKPFVTGNCQGGWATMILAATHPDLTGPIVIAGVPLSPWAGREGQNPLRYLGGWVGGALPATLAADMTGGLFDGAMLVANFEAMNPGRDIWRKYAELWAGIDHKAADYLDFDRWWSGFYFMNAAEIRWIIDNIFVGNRLARGLAVLDDGTRIDLGRITAPVIVFASHGDAVSTVPQALRWIPDVWGTAAAIRRAGRTIIYTTHDSASHLSIFVSAAVADDHHRRIGMVMRTIESLPPGLYEMVVDRSEAGEEMVRFEARETDAIRALCDPQEHDEPFAVAAEFADWAQRGYEMGLAPTLRALSSQDSARALMDANPLRLQALAQSSANPIMVQIAEAAERARAERAKPQPENPFLRAQTAFIDVVATQLDAARIARDALTEMGFLATYANPLLRPRPELAKPFQPPAEPASDPSVRLPAEDVERGGYADAIVRMCVILSRAGGQLRQDRLERFSAMLHTRAPFDSLSAETRRRMIDTQSRIVEAAGEAATKALMKMLRDDVDRYRAVNIVLDVMEIGPESPRELIAAFASIQLSLRTRARNWSDDL
jgi:pimeloyl-ACP methyl ester carboxylesterase/tellurite resistance protein